MGLSFPRLSGSDLEQFLLEEAVMLRFHAERQERDRHERARTDARDQAKGLLSQLRPGGGR